MASRKSFLDDLLADEPSSRFETSKRGKSVRFIDNEDVLEAISSPATANRSKSTEPLDSKQDSRASLTATRPVSSSSKRSDWLGLLEDDPSLPITRPSTTKEAGTRLKVGLADEKNDLEIGSWLDDGLSERRAKSRRPTSSSSSEEKGLTSKSEESWLDFKKSIKETKKSDDDDDGKEPISEKTAEIYKTHVKENVKESISTPSTSTAIDSATSQKEILILQAKVDILNMEKEHLSMTITQMKENHQAEINVLKALHEQQLSMTVDVYKKQEEILRDERDRRIADLKGQLETYEREREELRTRYNEKVDLIENEYRDEIEKLKEMHKSLVKRLNEQHEADLDRLRRIKTQEIEALSALHEQSSSLENLVTKWQTNADRIESLHRALISKEEEIVKGKVDSLESKDKRLDLIEENWLSLKREVEREKKGYEETKDKLIRLLDEQRTLINGEQARLTEDRKLLETERHKFVEEKHRWEEEVTKIRDKLDRERKEIKSEGDKLAEKAIELEKKESQLVLREIDWKHEMSKEKEHLNRLTSDVNEERKILIKERSTLQESCLNLQSEQQKLENKKILFDGEKEKLKQLAEKIAENAVELENLGSISLKEREEGLRALETASRLKDEVDMKTVKIERKSEYLIKEAMRIEMEQERIQQEWKVLQETKHSIVCSLCGNGLSRVKFRSRDAPLIPNFYHENAYSNIEDNDRMLLIWQISAQQDAAMLAEETAFVKSLKHDEDYDNR